MSIVSVNVDGLKDDPSKPQFKGGTASHRESP
jgi:hypothetical protein